MKLESSVILQAMSLNIATDDHPNKMPFSGVMTRIGEPSDTPPHGSNGKLITISAEAADKALSSLLGMAVDYKPNLDGHDPQAKIGIITGATIEGNAILIEGFIYASDFPQVAAEIKANQGRLGFSYEARDLYCADPKADPCVITECVFTGAAILRRDKAAYRTTSIAASAEEDKMDKEMLEGLAAGLKALTEKFDSLHASVEDIRKQAAEKIEANASTRALVEPHAAALEKIADGMEASGIGSDPQNGHAVALRKLAGHLRAAAAMGRVPSVYHGDMMHAAAEPKADASAELSKKLDEMVKPLADGLKALETKLADVKASAVVNAPAPERKTLSPAIATLLAKSGVEMPEGEGGRIPLVKLDSALKELSVAQRLQVKTGLKNAGLLD